MLRVFRHIVTFVLGALAGRRSARLPESPSRKSVEVARAKRSWRWWVGRAAIAVPLLALAGFLVAASGIIPIKASSGHWAITAWLLEFSMSRSVATHSLGIKPPPLDDPVLVMKGAGHYEHGCMPCHGSPMQPYPRVAWAMTPPPPNLTEAIPEWKSRELFYIVKHGVKFTGMPAWPSQVRDDEVWAMVAFLEQMPSLSPVEYRQLVHGAPAPGGDSTPASALDSADASPLMALVEPAKPPRTVTANCGRCHGEDGQGRGNSAFPKLAGQKPQYMYAALRAYAEGRRQSGIMHPLAAALSRDDMREVAMFYAGLPPMTGAAPDTTDASAIARGEYLASNGDPANGIPACRECHGPTPTRRNPYYPHLAGQYQDYLRLQLELFQQDHRGGSQFAHLMHPTAERLTPEQVRDVAAYYASLGAGR